jgi:hypothetical protein
MFLPMLQTKRNIFRLICLIVSKLRFSDNTYEEKKRLFGEKYNLCGLDFYQGGIYDQAPGVISVSDTSTLINSWDWRERHGANDTLKADYYYDGDITGTGWLTPADDQTKRPFCTGLC